MFNLKLGLLIPSALWSQALCPWKTYPVPARVLEFVKQQQRFLQHGLGSAGQTVWALRKWAGVEGEHCLFPLSAWGCGYKVWRFSPWTLSASQVGQMGPWTHSGDAGSRVDVQVHSWCGCQGRQACTRCASEEASDYCRGCCSEVRFSVSFCSLWKL